MRTIEVKGQEHATRLEALAEAGIDGTLPISIAGRYFTVTREEYDRLQRNGIEPSAYHDHASGRIVCVPGRHG